MSVQRSSSTPSTAGIKFAIVPILLIIELAITWYAYYLTPPLQCGTDTVPWADDGMCAVGHINLSLYYAGLAALIITATFYLFRDSKRYAATVGLLAAPLSILLAARIVDTSNYFLMHAAAGHLPATFIYWATGVLEKPNIIYLGGAFMSTLLIAPATFQLLHNKAYCRLLAIGACTLTFAIYATILLFPAVLSNPVVFRALN